MRVRGQGSSLPRRAVDALQHGPLLVAAPVRTLVRVRVRVRVWVRVRV